MNTFKDFLIMIIFFLCIILPLLWAYEDTINEVKNNIKNNEIKNEIIELRNEVEELKKRNI